MKTSGWVCRLAVGAFGCSLVAVNVAQATTRYVSPSGGHMSPFTTLSAAATNIQDAIDVSSAGDQVLVADGVYGYGEVDIPNRGLSRIAVPGGVKVLSMNGPATTTIVGAGPMGDGAVRCAHLGPGAVLSGFTLTNGATRTVGADGGGAWLDSNAVLSNCTLTGNSAAYRGGGAFAYNGFLYDCRITGNAADLGGGVYAGDLWDCVLTENSADQGGGAYYGRLRNCSIISNSVARFGGGVRSAALTTCTLAGNTAGRDGGGASGGSLEACTVVGNRTDGLGGGTYAAPSRNCRFVNNVADYGGGSCRTVHYNCLFTGNSATHQGGAAYIPDMRNCTLAGNTANEGGGVYDGKVRNCVVYHNRAPMGANYTGTTIALNYTCTTPLPMQGEGNTASPPLFLDTNSWSNLRLDLASPCIDTGSNLMPISDVTDFDGLPRIMQGTVDMGAYEWPHLVITDLTGPNAPDGPVITWASFSNAVYSVYATTNFVHGYNILLQDQISATPPENRFTDTVTGGSVLGYRVEYAP